MGHLLTQNLFRKTVILMFMSCKLKCLHNNYPNKSEIKRNFFKNIQPGDIIEFKVPFGQQYYGKNTKAVYITCTNTRTWENEALSFRQIGNVMQDFMFDEKLD